MATEIRGFHSIGQSTAANTQVCSYASPPKQKVKGDPNRKLTPLPENPLFYSLSGIKVSLREEFCVKDWMGTILFIWYY